MKLHINNCDSSVEHSEGYCVDIPEGSSEYTFLHFLTPALVKTSTGLTEVEPGACVMYSPHNPQYYRGAGERWSNDHLTFSGTSSEKIVLTGGFSLNEVFYPYRTHYIASLFEKMKTETLRRELNWDRVSTLALEEFILKLSRYANDDLSSFSSDHSHILREVRAVVHERMVEHWAIEEMALLANLSSSRFAALFKNEFGISPTEDLIRERIERAKTLLSNVRVSVKEISSKCGFESVHYFHRAFKKRVGVTPRHYHKMKNPTAQTRMRGEFTLDELSQGSDFGGIIQIKDGEVYFHGDSDGWAEFLGWSATELVDKPFFNFVDPQDLVIGREALGQITQRQNLRDITIRLRKKGGGHRIVEFSAISKGNTWFWFARKLPDDFQVHPRN
jgi:AraC family transcriptional regulator, arabinose operon regulatory protein